MNTSSSSEFYYHAHGTAIAGAINRPVSYMLDTVASVALPIIGGAASANAGNTVHSHPQLGNVLSYQSASTQLAGSLNDADGTHNTLVTVTVEGLNLLDTVTADRIVLKLSSKHHDSEEEGHIIPLGSSFTNLRVAGHPVEVELDHELFAGCDTYAAFKERYKTDAAFRKRARKQFLWGDYDADTPQFLKDRFKWSAGKDAVPESHGLVPCNMVKSIKHDSNVLQTFGNVIIVPQFGKLFFGEVIMKNGLRHVTMLRFQLGSPLGGGGTVGGGTGNGSTWP
jgi:hypothetical protein